MRDLQVHFPGLRWATGLALAALIALALAPAALAQQEDQYGATTAPEGPAAGEPATVEAEGDDDGVVGPGTVLVIEGDFDVSEGSSVTLQDSDGTQGTLIDGENAEITEGSIIIEVTADPLGVAGGDGVLNTDGLFVVATTGITARDAEAVAGDGTAVAGDAVAGDGAAAAGEAAAGDGTATAGEAAAGDGTATAGEAAAGDGTAVAGGAAAGEGAAAAGDGAIAGEEAAAGAEAEAATDEGPVGGVLPDTGGSLLILLAAGLALLGAGFLVRRQLVSR